MKALRTKVFWFAIIAILATLGLGSGKVKALGYSSGFYYDNGESSYKISLF